MALKLSFVVHTALPCPTMPCPALLPQCLNLLVISLVSQQAYHQHSCDQCTSVMVMVLLSVIPALMQVSELTVKTSKYQQPISVECTA